MADIHKNKKTQLADPIENLYIVTPNDSVDLADTSRMFMATTSPDNQRYNIQILCDNDTTPIILENLYVGVMYAFRVKRIYSTSTTATKIVVGY